MCHFPSSILFINVYKCKEAAILSVLLCVHLPRRHLFVPFVLLWRCTHWCTCAVDIDVCLHVHEWKKPLIIMSHCHP